VLDLLFKFGDMSRLVQLLLRFLTSVSILLVIMISFVVVPSLAAAGGAAKKKYSSEEPLGRLSFGSCNDQKKDQGIWKAITASDPDVWLWLGDNIYADRKTKSYPKAFDPATIEEMRLMYEKQKKEPEYVKLRSQVGKLVGTWDDHDYGLDDSGKEFPWKRESKELFHDFLDEPKDSPLRRREGVYNSHVFGPPGRRVKLIILDTRYHRDPIFSNGDMLGEEQWHWLEEELVRSDAQVNLVASSIQFIPNHHATLCPLCNLEDSPFRVESWCHFSREKQRFVDLITRNKVEGVILLSGDIHSGELLEASPSCILPYSLYEITSSGMTHSAMDSFPRLPLEIMKIAAPNPCSLGMYLGKNFGTVDFSWEGRPNVTLTVRDDKGAVALEKVVSIDTLTYADSTAENEVDCVWEDDLHWTRRCRFCIIVFSLFLLVLFLIYYLVASFIAVAMNAFSGITSKRRRPIKIL